MLHVYFCTKNKVNKSIYLYILKPQTLLLSIMDIIGTQLHII